MLDDRREGAYEIMQTIADKQGVDHIRMFNREGKLMFSTDPRERASILLIHDEVCTSVHTQAAVHLLDQQGIGKNHRPFHAVHRSASP